MFVTLFTREKSELTEAETVGTGLNPPTKAARMTFANHLRAIGVKSAVCTSIYKMPRRLKEPTHSAKAPRTLPCRLAQLLEIPDLSFSTRRNGVVSLS